MISPKTDTTPAGLQTRALLFRRRLIVAGLNGITYLALLWWLASILSVSGWSVIDIAIFACFAIAAPWSVLGVWNAFLGVWLLHGGKDARNAVAPFAAVGRRRCAGDRAHRDPHDDPQRGPGPRLRPRRGGEGEPRRHGAGRRVRLFRPLRHQRRRCRPCRGTRLRGVEGPRRRVRRPAVLPPPHVERGLQGRQPARLLRPLGARLRIHAAARRRQPDGRRDNPAHGAHRTGLAEAGHSAEPCRRRAAASRRSRASSSSACATACGPTPWAARGGRAIAARSGATTRSCASRPSWSIAICRSCRAGRRWAGRSCRTTRSRRC